MSLAGSVVGQEDGLTGTGGGSASLADADSGYDRSAAESITEALSAEEIEGQRIIDAGETVDAPSNALSAPMPGRSADDLKRISGIGPKIEGQLNDNGVYHFDQIANFSGRDLAWADQTLGFKGRVVRDRWIPQARGLASETAVGGAAAGGASASSKGSPDDLTRIRGVGRSVEKMLNSEDVYTFEDVLAYEKSPQPWIDPKWMPEARRLLSEKRSGGAGGGNTGGGGQSGSSGSEMRTRFAAIADESADTGSMIDIPEALSAEEIEAQTLIDRGILVARPDQALSKPNAQRAPDDLKLISGVGPKIESQLNENGIYYFDQVANFSGRDLAWADQTLGFKGRVIRDRWIPQARGLAKTAHLHAKPAGDAETHAFINTPYSDEEAEAMRLISDGDGYVADESNAPAMLLPGGPKDGRADNLQEIKGIGEKLDNLLNGLGIYHFEQIGNFTARDIAWVDSKLKFKGRIVRDRWVPQAKALAKS